MTTDTDLISNTEWGITYNDHVIRSVCFRMLAYTNWINSFNNRETNNKNVHCTCLTHAVHGVFDLCIIICLPVLYTTVWQIQFSGTCIMIATQQLSVPNICWEQVNITHSVHFNQL